MRRVQVGGHGKSRVSALIRWALVDDADFERLSEFVWCYKERSDGNGGYVYRYIKDPQSKSKRGVGRRLLHHDVLQVLSSVEIDHRNGDGLDNQRRNLRRATHAQNCRNQRTQSTGRKTSKFKGVGKASPNRWRARIRLDGKLIDLGHFESEVEAAAAYNSAATALFREYAKLNEGVRP